MHVFRTKKRLAIGAGIAVLSLGLATGAYAYFTNGGAGTGTATVGTSTAITVSGTAAGLAYPGGAAQTVSFTATNPGSGHQQLGTITLTGVNACPAGYTFNPTGVGADPAGCYADSGGAYANNEITTCESFDAAAPNALTDNWYMAPVVANQDLANGASNAVVTATGSLVMNNLPSSQDLCKGAHLFLTFSTS